MFLEREQELIMQGFNDVCARNKEFIKEPKIQVENMYHRSGPVSLDLQYIETTYSFIVEDYSILPKLEMEFSGVGVELKHETIDMWSIGSDGMKIKVKGCAFLREGLA